MNYIEALQALVDGKRIREKDWDKNDYVYIKDGFITTAYGDSTDLIIDDIDDITDDTWETYQTNEDKLMQAGKRWELREACRNINCGICESKHPKLYKVCDNIVGTVMRFVEGDKASDDEVDALYKALKGEIDD